MIQEKLKDQFFENRLNNMKFKGIVIINQKKYLLNTGEVDWDNFNLKLLRSVLSDKKIIVFGFNKNKNLMRVDPDLWINIFKKNENLEK